jgi:hypothetical protein
VTVITEAIGRANAPIEKFQRIAESNPNVAFMKPLSLMFVQLSQILLKIQSEANVVLQAINRIDETARNLE